MIDAGEIFAEIDGSEGMVRFLEDPEHFDSPELMARLDGQIQKSIHLADRLQAANHTVRMLTSIHKYSMLQSLASLLIIFASQMVCNEALVATFRSIANCRVFRSFVAHAFDHRSRATRLW